MAWVRVEMLGYESLWFSIVHSMIRPAVPRHTSKAPSPPSKPQPAHEYNYADDLVRMMCHHQGSALDVHHDLSCTPYTGLVLHVLCLPVHGSLSLLLFKVLSISNASHSSTESTSLSPVSCSRSPCGIGSLAYSCTARTSWIKIVSRVRLLLMLWLMIVACFNDGPEKMRRNYNWNGICHICSVSPVLTELLWIGIILVASSNPFVIACRFVCGAVIRCNYPQQQSVAVS